MASEQKIEKQLEKKVDILLNDLEPEELKKLIQKLTEEYYSSYFSNKPVVNEVTFNNLNKLVENYSSKFDVEAYINYCFLLAVNDFLEKHIHKDITLKPFKVDLVKTESDVIVNRLEIVKQKRRELKEVINNKNVPEKFNKVQ